MGVLAIMEEEAARCSGCGQPRDEAWVTPDPDNPDPWVAKDFDCWACEAKERHVKAAGDKGPPPWKYMVVVKDE